jgi:uncharacterized protein
MLLYALLGTALAGTLPGIPTTLTESAGGWQLSESSGMLKAYDGWTLASVDGQPVEDIAELGARVFDVDEIALTLVDSDQSEKTLIVPVNIAGIRKEETIAWPDGVKGTELTWQTTRFQHPLLAGEGRLWSVNITDAEIVPAREGTTPIEYVLPFNFFKLEADWYIDGVAYSDAAIAQKFVSAYILGRWRKTDQDVLLVPTQTGLDVHFVDLARHHGRFPTCDTGVPETCLTYGLEILSEMGDAEGATEAALGQFDLGCQAGIGRACLEIVAQGRDAELADLAEQCIDGDVQDCGKVGETLLASGNSPQVALNILQDACDQGLAPACRIAADHLADNATIDHAIALFDAGCVHGDMSQCESANGLRHKAFATEVAARCTAEPADADSCWELGKLLEVEDVDHIEIHPFDAFQVSCIEGNQDACKRMGYYVDRWGVSDDRVVRATTDLLAACHTDDKVHACVGAAHLMVRLPHRSDEYIQSRQLFMDACTEGEVAGCLGGASRHWVGKAKQLEGPSNLDLATRACDMDSPEGCNLLGKLYNEKRSGLSGAIVAWDKGCKLGSQSACTQVGILLLDRKHPQHKEIKPADQFRSACELGDSEACYRLGILLSPSVKIPSDTEAFDLFQKSCDDGYALACERLGEIHLLRKTYFEAEIAAKYLDSACDDRVLEGCALLSKMYRSGNGVQKDAGEARKLALKSGNLEPRKHVRLGGKVGFLNLIGAEVEVMVPTPVFGLSLGTDFSFLPGSDLSLLYLGPTVRMYPSPKGRGLFMTVGYHQFNVSTLGLTTQNRGVNVKFGVRSQQGRGWVSSEFGLGTMQVPAVAEVISPIPVLIPMFALSGGWAPI